MAKVILVVGSFTAPLLDNISGLSPGNAISILIPKNYGCHEGARMSIFYIFSPWTISKNGDKSV